MLDWGSKFVKLNTLSFLALLQGKGNLCKFLHKKIISFLYCILKSVKILFLSFRMDQICVLHGKYI